jgi:hypothetical protein
VGGQEGGMSCRERKLRSEREGKEGWAHMIRQEEDVNDNTKSRAII